MAAAAAARPQTTVQKLGDADGGEQVAIPSVLLAPIRPDVVHFVHTSMNKNRRQPYAVSPGAGHQHSAESWGTGRAVSRIPRVSGSGTSAAAQGAFGNMCRKGRMFAPTKTYRKWHKKINTNQRRFAVASALAASAIPSLVIGRGHRVDNVPEVPLVVPASVESVSKTRKAIEILNSVGGYDDVVKAKNSRKLRAGKGKMRDRRHVQRRGPLVVYAEDNGLVKAFRNLPGVEVANVNSLNLLQLAPGGHLGRFVIWTKPAFQRLNALWGTFRGKAALKADYSLPRNLMSNTDITRIINSDEVQSKLRSQKNNVRRARRKKNPLKNLGAMVKLNPHALSLRRSELLAAERRAKGKAAKVSAARKAADKKHNPQQRANYRRISAE